MRQQRDEEHVQLGGRVAIVPRWALVVALFLVTMMTVGLLSIVMVVGHAAYTLFMSYSIPVLVAFFVIGFIHALRNTAAIVAALTEGNEGDDRPE